MSTMIRTHCGTCEQLVEVTIGRVDVAADNVVADVHVDVCACGPRDFTVKSPLKRKPAKKAAKKTVAKAAPKKKASKK